MSNAMQHKTAFKAIFTSLALIILLGLVDLCKASKRVLTEVSNTESSAEDFVYGLLKDQDVRFLLLAISFSVLTQFSLCCYLDCSIFQVLLSLLQTGQSYLERASRKS